MCLPFRRWRLLPDAANIESGSAREAVGPVGRLYVLHGEEILSSMYLRVHGALFIVLSDVICYYW